MLLVLNGTLRENKCYFSPRHFLKAEKEKPSGKGLRKIIPNANIHKFLRLILLTES